jgi:hypothetical protein
MYVSVHHSIADPQKWDQTTKNIMAMTEQGRLPEGLKGLMYLPAVDGRKADCVWEANSLDALKKFLDREIGTSAQNEYIPIKADAAFGLPGKEALHAAA